MSASLDEVNAMVTFAKVVQTRSFSLAARELDLSKSAVSKRIAALEERLGVRLLNRSTRKLSTTEAGEAFFERCARILEEAEAALSAAAEHQEEPQGLLRVNGPIVFGQLHLEPLVAPVLAAWPKLRIELSLTDQFIDPIADRQDITVRIARLADSSLVARKICDDRRVVCASPGYLARRGRPQSPQDLAQHDCLHFTRIPLRDEWRFRVPGTSEEFSVPVAGRLSTDSGTAMLAAMLAGVGVAILPYTIVGQALREGLAQELLSEFVLPGYAVYAIHGHRRHVPPKVRVFLDALVERMRQVKALGA